MWISDGMKRYIGLTKLPPAALGSCWEHGPFPYETYRMQAIKLLDRWIFEEYAPPVRSDLALYRIVYASIALLAVPPIGWWLVDVPAAFFNPPLSLSACFYRFPPFSVLTFLYMPLIMRLATLRLGSVSRAA